jgi:phycoerythrin beta chain
MLDAFSRTVVNADSKTACISGSALQSLKDYIASGNRRLDAVKLISTNSNQIATHAVTSIIGEDNSLIKPGGQCYPMRRMAACLRDCEIILRYITYALLAGDPSVLDDRCLNGLKETYIALGVPLGSVAQAIEFMKSSAIDSLDQPHDLTPGDYSSLAAELSDYFDRAINALS